MFNDHNVSQKGDETELKRRQIIQMMGTGVIGISGLGVTPSVTQAAEDDTVNVEEISGPEKREAVSDAEQASEFEQLRQHFREAHGLSTNDLGASAYQLKGGSGGNNARVGMMVTFPLEHRRSSANHSDEFSTIDEAEIVLIFENGNVNDARGSIVTKSENETEVRFEIVTVKRNELKTEVETIAFSENSNIRDSISPQASTECDVCVTIAEFVCENGCGLSGIALCAAVGFPAGGPLGSIGCSILAYFICREFDSRTNCWRTSRVFCYNEGYCSTRPLATRE